ncbi:MAG: response regulator transcription factor [Phycisphaerae bacterium]|nr:response regulator transcription factor [Phycisphaerae bacterium]
MAREAILLVEDEDDIQELVKYNLEREGYRVTAVGTGEAALQEVARRQPDLIVLDLMLPDLDGLTVCKRLKADPETKGIPVAMLTAKGEEPDIVTGLEVGADEYITKPFSPRVLVARIRAVLRRCASPDTDGAETVLRRGDLMINVGRHEVRVQGRPVSLTYTEFRVLHVLAQRPGVVFSRYQIVDAVRGEDYPVTDRSVDVQIVGLRRKLGSCGRYIETVRGVGYRFRTDT